TASRAECFRSTVAALGGLATSSVTRSARGGSGRTRTRSARTRACTSVSCARDRRPGERVIVRRVAVNAESARIRPLFAVSDDVYRWEDVVQLARLRGDWAALAERVRAGLHALEEVRARREEPAAAEIDAARREFRYERGLLAGDELDA